MSPELLAKAGTLVAIIVLGLVVKRLGWVKESDFLTLSTIALRITLPCALATSFNTFEIRPARLSIALVGFMIMAITAAVAFLLEVRRGSRAQALAVLNSPGVNIGLFAIPYVSTFIGPEAVLVASLFDVGNALATAGLAYVWGVSLTAERKPTIGGAIAKLFRSPVFVTYLALVTMRLLGITLPPLVIGFTSLVGGANTFVAMFMIGVGLSLTWDRRRYATAARLLAYRYATFAVLGVAMWLWAPLPAADKIVIAMLLGGPLAAMSSGFTAEAGLDVRTSTLVTSTSVLVAIVAMPTLLALLS